LGDKVPPPRDDRDYNKDFEADNTEYPLPLYTSYTPIYFGQLMNTGYRKAHFGFDFRCIPHIPNR